MNCSAYACIFGEIGIFILAFVYIFYPLFLKIYSIKTRSKKKTENLKRDKIFRKYSLTVIIPFYNELHIIKKKLQSINIDASKYKDFSAIVVNDGNNSFTDADLLKSINPEDFKFKIKIMRLPEQFGKSFAQYAASRQTDSDYILITDSNSIFENNYFNILSNHLTAGEDIFCGILRYKNNAAPEKSYWALESNLKLLEQKAGFYNTGLFGSNILIKRELYNKFPYYVLCDFSLPLYYQNETNNRVFIKEDLEVYENDADKLQETFKAKKRIIHRALFGLYKTFILSNRFNKVLFLQIFFHKILRWFTWLWILFIIPYIYLTIKNIIFKQYFQIIIVLLLFVSIIYGAKKIFYAAAALTASFLGVIHFFIKPQL
ncbi:MAG TPA: glycosyltransferase, partial [bacterium]|nr:glycosyltransferase [bacterium]